MSSYGQDVWRVKSYCCSSRAVIVLIMEEEQEMVGRQFISFEELELTFAGFGLSQLPFVRKAYS